MVVISAVNNIHGAQSKLTNTLERITTGNRINSAADDAAGLSLSSQQFTDNASLKVAMRNISEGVSLVQTAEGSLATLADILVRMRELSVQSATETYATYQRDMMNTEFTELTEEYDRIVANSEYNTHKLLNGSVSSLKLQAGHLNNSSHQISLNISSFDVRSASIGLSTVFSNGIGTTSDAQDAFSVLDQAMSTVNNKRTIIGSYMHKLDHALNDASAHSAALAVSAGRIMDADFANESSQMAKNQIMFNASSAILGQASAMKASSISLIGQ